MKQYHITEELFLAGMKRSRRKYILIIYLVLLLLPPLALLEHGLNPTGYRNLGILYAIALIVALLIPSMLNAVSRRIYRNNPLYQKQQSVEVTESTFRLEAENGCSNYQLRELKKIEFYTDVILIWPATTIFHAVPPGLLSEQELEWLKAAPVTVS